MRVGQYLRGTDEVNLGFTLGASVVVLEADRLPMDLKAGGGQDRAYSLIWCRLHTGCTITLT